MNQQLVTTGIVLSRIEYGEADRIVTFLTPDHGKLRLMAKGVRRVKSKLAGGIELFSVTHLTFVRGRGEIGTLISARLQIHYGRIIDNLDRTMLGYELIAQLHKATEDEPEPNYFHLLEQAFAALNDSTLNLDLIRLWFSAQLLRLGGHTPNLSHDTEGSKLLEEQTYTFSFEDSTFVVHPDGEFSAQHIKYLRLLFSGHGPAALSRIRLDQARQSQILRLVVTLQSVG